MSLNLNSGVCVMKLSELKPGEAGTIEKIDGSGPVLQRLLELGLREGKTVRVLQTALFGDPVCIEFDGMRLALRKNEAAQLNITQ